VRCRVRDGGQCRQWNGRHGGDGLGRDFISEQTACLYTKFREGTPAGDNYGPGAAHVTSANDLQKAA
jgi:hypothetical protein